MKELGYMWFPVVGGYIILWISIIKWIFGPTSGWIVLLVAGIELYALIVWSYELTGEIVPDWD